MGAHKWNSAAFYIAVVACWALLHGILLTTSDASPLDHRLSDTDSYMRLERVTELVHGQGWYDNVVERSNAPFGDELHWTRPFDVLIVAGAGPLIPFLGTDDAVFWSGALICSLLHLGIIFALLWAARPLLGQRSPLLVAVVMVQPALLTAVEPGRFDHHALQLFLFAIVLGCGLRLLMDGSVRFAVVAGIAGALGIWVSVEMILPVGILGFALAAQWVLTGSRRPLDALRSLSFATAAGLAVALIVERPPSDLLTVEQDRISIEHVFAAAVAALVLWASTFVSFGGGAANRRGRLLRALAAALTIGGIVMAVFPRAILGPEADIDPAIRSIWLDKVGEMQPLLKADIDMVGPLLLYTGQAFVALVSVLIVLRNRRRGQDAAAWAMLALVLVIYLALTLQHLRAGGYLAVSASIPLVQGLIDLRRWMTRWTPPVVRAAAWATACVGCCGGFLVVGGAMTASAIANSDTADLGTCPLDEVTHYLSDPDGLGGERHTIAAAIDFGPQLIAETPHSVLAGPYHRNASGIRDLYDLLTTNDSAAAKKIVDSRGIDLFLVCPSVEESLFFNDPERSDSLYIRIRDGAGYPAWLRPVPVPESAEGHFKLYEVVER
ncbi:MAG: hypothetical protein AB7J35_05665 [Dehalococcoidia bacterium]